MRLVVTGGGTGGHVYPAIEIALRARELGYEVLYMGSLQGQERLVCERVKIPFWGADVQAVTSLKKPNGWMALAKLLRASVHAKKRLKVFRANTMMSFGGYSSAAIVQAAGSLRLPYGVHEQNSVPGRTNLLAAKKAKFVATVFHQTSTHFSHPKVVRTGMPVRKDLRQAANHRQASFQGELGQPTILAMGGSQGAASLNEAVLSTAKRMIGFDAKWIQISGKAHFEKLFPSVERLGLNKLVALKAFCESEELAQTLGETTVFVGRSGAGTIAELAAFRIPGIFVPYPLAFADHQRHNAKEIAESGGGEILEQSDLSPATLERLLTDWIGNQSKRDRATLALAEWDVADATERIFAEIQSLA